MKKPCANKVNLIKSNNNTSSKLSNGDGEAVRAQDVIFINIYYVVQLKNIECRKVKMDQN